MQPYMATPPGVAVRWAHHPMSAAVTVQIAESVSAPWQMHLITHQSLGPALCGQNAVANRWPLESWGRRGALGEQWCPTCAEQATAHNDGAPH